jgi:serine/threonine protein phosphatase PrpC
MREAHTMIKASRFMNEKDPHSTAVMLLLQPGKVTWAHCGDSRLYHFRGRQLVRRSVDHSYVEHLLATGRITEEQALTHPNRNVLLTSLGGQEEPKFDFSESAELVAGDAFVLCSDGLWAYFDDAELGRLVADNSARQACELLIESARQRAGGAGDNVSLAIVKLVEAPAPVKAALPEGFVPRARA